MRELESHAERDLPVLLLVGLGCDRARPHRKDRRAVQRLGRGAQNYVVRILRRADPVREQTLRRSTRRARRPRRVLGRQKQYFGSIGWCESPGEN